MQQIDHNPNEKRPTNAIWWILAVVLAVNWTGYLSFFPADWVGIALGLGTGAVVVLWAIEMTGNKVPDWMK